MTEENEPLDHFKMPSIDFAKLFKKPTQKLKIKKSKQKLKIKKPKQKLKIKKSKQKLKIKKSKQKNKSNRAKNFICNTCKTAFISTRRLKQCQRRHKGIKAFVCPNTAVSFAKFLATNSIFEKILKCF